MSQIEDHSIFGDYSQTENRITAALLHVLNLGGEKLLYYLFDNSIFQIPDSGVRIDTQSKSGTSVPDGHIFADFSFNIFIESKILPNAVNETQLARHLECIKSPNDILLYITPDSLIPKILDNNVKIVWMNWYTLAEKLNNYPCGEEAILKFLVEQFILLLTNHGLLQDWKNRVLIVGGSWGETVALKYNFYACQAGRSFKKSKYLAFAYNNQICNLFEIVSCKDNINLRDVVENSAYFKEFEPGYSGQPRQYMKLDRVQGFNNTIDNDSVDKNGNRCAFVQNQTYTTYDKFIRAKHTSELR